jgi:hypothetical protein
MNGAEAFLQYGGLGLLALTLIGIYKLAYMFLKAMISGWTALIENIKSLVTEVKGLNQKIEKLCTKVNEYDR